MPHRHRSLGVVALVLVAAPIMVPLVSSATPRRTSIVIVRPVGDTGRPVPGYRVVARLTGTCEPGSDASTRPDVWRCASPQGIVDPCFLGQHRSRVVYCLLEPWSRQLIRLSVTQPLGPQPTTSPPGAPWGIEQAHGVRCTYVQGASEELHGLRLDYACSDGSVGYGAPRQGATWIGLFAPGTGTTRLVSKRLVRVWY